MTFPIYFFLGCLLATFLSLAALLKWKHRRMAMEDRINRSLRAYAAERPVEAEMAPPRGGSFAL